MKIDDDFKVVCLGPINSFEEVIVLSLDVRFARTDIVSPIAYRDAHVIESNTFPCSERVRLVHQYDKHEPSVCNCGKVILCNPSVPMLNQCCLCNTWVLVLSKCPLVNNIGISRVVEEAWCYPRLCIGGGFMNEMTEEVEKNNDRPPGRATLLG